MMWSWRVRLISSMIAASVVDFPEPVGPVTRTSPRGLSTNDLRMPGRPSSSSDLRSAGMSRKAAPRLWRWKKTFTRKRASPGIEYEMSICRLTSKCFCCSVERMR
jgi:hypothetical protein